MSTGIQVPVSNAAATLWRTVGATVLGPLAWALVTACVAALIGIQQRLFTVLRPEVLDFSAAMCGTAAGMIAAKTICNTLLSGYSPKAVAVEFISFSVIGLTLLWLFLSGAIAPITSTLQLFLIICLSLAIFWQADTV